MSRGGPTVAVLGGGQLGRMLAIAGHRLGVRVRCLDPEPDACAGRVTECLTGAFSDEAALSRLLEGADAATYEFENVPVEAAAWCAGRVPMHPTVEALSAAQDRVEEKALLGSHGLAAGPHRLIETEAALAEAVRSEAEGGLGVPAFLKTCRGGYDGKGQVRIETPDQAAGAWAALASGRARARLVLEALVPFEREVSLLAVRAGSGPDAGGVRFYEPVCNEHEGGILVRSTPAGPARDGGALDRARSAIRSLMDAMGYVGVLAVEMFELPDGRLLASEMAPRVHNSGHWTIDAAACDQFENHLRAVLGWPLGSTETLCRWEMRNCIGEIPDPADLLARPGLRLHAYGKSAKPGRKVGHVTVVGG